ncbi:MAG TPA: twin-arginine translocase TatA/TatE family subunit [Bacteroidales bacterium]|mgnify:FL=1|jgi:sec-independent protein translocase protein TatA|nr:twin-arginine translocase TatA/TatE family subunit [Bacteroidales bacterium]
MSGQEIFVIIIVVLLLFGADKLPEIARTVSRGMRDFRKATDDIRREFEESTSEIRRDIADVTNSITSDVNDISDTIQRDANEVAGNIEKNINEFKEDVDRDLNEVKTNLEADIPAENNAVAEANVTEETVSAEGGETKTEDTAGDVPGEESPSYKRTINEPDDNYYRYSD